MKSKLALTTFFSLICFLSYSQIPQGFNYQAVARDATGQIITNTSMPVRIAIQTSLSGGTTIWEEEHLSVTTNQFGVLSLVVGTGTKLTGTASSFSAIDWNSQVLYLKTTIRYPGTTWTAMGTAQIWSVPYSMVAKDVEGPVNKLGIQGTTSNLEEALFEVKNKSGQTVFAVYNEGVRVYVEDGKIKGAKGGFAVGGFGTGKAVSQKYLYVDADSIRAYIDEASGKAAKGGFAVGGFNMSKSTSGHFFDVATDENGIINPSENRVVWYPLKNALLTGKVLVERPDSVGENSFASGFESKAIGDWSQALGFKAVARGDYSTAIGKNAIAGKTNSFALGDSPKATGADSYAFGAGAIASGNGSYALGSFGRDRDGNLTSIRTTASGDYSFAVGLGSVSSGLGAFTFGAGDTAAGWFSTVTGLWNKVEAAGLCAMANGLGTKAGNFFATAFGDHTYASGHTSFATGFTTTASGQLSSTFGDQTSATGYATTAFGYHTTAQAAGLFVTGTYNIISGDPINWVNGDPMFIIGNGLSPTARSNAFTVLKNGNVGIGMPAPGYKLDVNGVVNLNRGITSGVALRVNGSEALWYDGSVYSWGYGGAYNVFADKVAVGTTGSPGSYSLYVVGSAYSTGGWAGSDIRWKKDLEPFRNILSEVTQLQGFKYNWRDDEYPEMKFDKDRQIGLIAQEVEKVFPELVRTDDNGYKAVSYEKLTVVLLEGIKEQQKQIEILQKQVEEFKTILCDPARDNK